ncbi:MAG: hypothetical protein M3346_05865 [Actinomycetota bacterium]|nr:hypothetical protein [Actinomycetota bacterium]
MQAVHAAGGMLLFGVAGVFVLAAFALAVLGGARPWLEWARRTLTFLLLLQVFLGAMLYATGDRPAEVIHVLYGALVAGVLPLAHAFSSEAPAKARAGVLAVAAVVILGLLWRLLSTGGG